MSKDFSTKVVIEGKYSASRHRFFNGREGARGLEPLKPLLESIVANWNPDSFDENLLLVGPSKMAEVTYVY